jgi:hypothetical protein
MNLTAKQVMLDLGVCRRTLRRYCRDRKINYFTYSGKVMFHPSAVELFKAKYLVRAAF